MPKCKTVEHGPSIGEMTTTSSNSLPANRAETGRFVPGQSGNPSGRPKRDENLAALARMHTEDAIAALVSIANDPNANPSARISAANSLLDRGHGKQSKSSVSFGSEMTVGDKMCADLCMSGRGILRARPRPLTDTRNPLALRIPTAGNRSPALPPYGRLHPPRPGLRLKRFSL